MKHVTAISRKDSTPLKADHGFEFLNMILELLRTILEVFGLLVSIFIDLGELEDSA